MKTRISRMMALIYIDAVAIIVVITIKVVIFSV